jgi:hypothetical protein
MRFRNLDIPTEVIEAYRKGELVIFVGAGASKDPPSSLPEFSKLVERIVQDSPKLEISGNRHDKTLGDLKYHYKIDVHRRVAKILNDADSKPNRTHIAIANLVANSPTPRLVTTNYDHHLTTALLPHEKSIREYVGPALPIGDDFEGIVYLHGKLGIDDSKLVLTDGDFGASYLRDGWATRFLDRMFSRFIVLYVGYSHSDPLVEYLAKGLRGEKPRYALTCEGDEMHWGPLGVQAITFKLEEGTNSYEALVQGLERWAEREASGLLGNEYRVSEILFSLTSLPPEDEDFLEEVLDDPIQAPFILDKSLDPGLLRWLSSKPIFRSLFSSEETPANSSANLIATWLSKFILASKENSEYALEIALISKGQLSPVLWNELASAIHRIDGLRPSWLDPWLHLLIENHPNWDRHLLNYAIEKINWNESSSAGLLLIEHLTNPHIDYSPGIGGSSDYEIDFRGDFYWLDRAKKTYLDPLIKNFAIEFLEIGERQLNKVRQLRVLYGSTNSFDLDSYRRAAIEPHSQNQFPSVLDFIIDLVRDSSEYLAENNRPEVECYIRLWQNSDYGLLRRLAIHIQIHRQDISADSRIEWILKFGYLNDFNCHHETFKLLKENVANASKERIEEIVDFLKREEFADHPQKVFTILSWIKSSGVENGQVQTLLNQLQSVNPDLGLTEHPDLTHWTNFAAFEHEDMPNFEEVIQTSAESPIRGLEYLREINTGFKFDVFHRSDSPAMELAKREPRIAINLGKLTTSDDLEIRDAFLSGWVLSEQIEIESAIEILELISNWWSSTPGSVASLLTNKNLSGDNGWWKVPRARELALSCWDSIANRTFVLESEDWLSHALNEPPGKLALFWIYVLEDDYRKSADSWFGITGQTKIALDAIIKNDQVSGMLSKSVMAGQIRFLDSIDHDWTAKNVIPLLRSPHKVETNLKYWEAFLTWGFWTDRLLESGLLEGYLDAGIIYSRISERNRERLALHLASILIKSEKIEDQIHCATKWSANFGEEIRTEVIEAFYQILRNTSTVEADFVWKNWLGEYWKQRLEGNPIPLTGQEGAGLLDLVPMFEDGFEEACLLAQDTPLIIGKHSFFLNDLKVEQVRAHGDQLLDLLIHITKQKNQDLWIYHRFREYFEIMKEVVSKERLDMLREAAISIGISEAISW